LKYISHKFDIYFFHFCSAIVKAQADEDPRVFELSQAMERRSLPMEQLLGQVYATALTQDPVMGAAQTWGVTVPF
jgi:hypothetical protein